MSDRLKALADAGVSIWLDDLSRERLTSGSLARLVDEQSVSGVTTNPTIFAAALSQGSAYDEQLRSLKAAGTDVADAIIEITTDDVRDACDVFAPVAARTGMVDGRVSIEVSPLLARDTEATVAEARQLSDKVGRDNVLIKIPATREGLSAITQVIAAGISVNVTLIFSLARYEAVIEAYHEGLEQAAAAGIDLSTIHSVASFFVSRVDAEVDKRLEAIGTEEALALRGKAGIANARAAYKLFLQKSDGDRWQALAAKGATPQRPLWASTGVKNPDYDDTMYVAQLIARDTVNTMPEKTMQAFADHGEVAGDTITPHIADAEATLAALEKVGIDLADVVDQLEDEGVSKFEVSWGELTETVRTELDKA